MIVDFPREKRKADEQLKLNSRLQMREHSPFLRMIKRHFQHEGETASYTTVDGETRELGYDLAEATVSIPVLEIPNLTVDDVQARVASSVADVAAQVTRGAFATMSTEIERAGNSIQVADPFSSEAYLQALETVLVDFDDTRDKPELPQFVGHPSQRARAEARWEAMTTDEWAHFNTCLDEILDRKYAEYISRENARKLVD
jgi:hypothetical protein